MPAARTSRRYGLHVVRVITLTVAVPATALSLRAVRVITLMPALTVVVAHCASLCLCERTHEPAAVNLSAITRTSHRVHPCERYGLHH
jgi:hypothetical protein